MIEVRDLSVTYGDFSLRDISLNVHREGCLAILGPSGAGKTLLLETVMGARRPLRGQVLLDGQSILRLPPERRRIAYIPQDLALFPHLSVHDNIMFGLQSRTARRGAEAALKRLITTLDLEPLLHRRSVTTLSGGEKRRVALARALIVQPRVLFLDEPFAALDAVTRTNLLRSLRSLRHTMQTTMFLVTHDLDEACFLADDVAIMMRGRIVDYGPRERVFRRPRTAAVARFLNLRNIVPLPRLQAAGLLNEEAADDGCTHVAVRPEAVNIMAADHARVDAVPARLDALAPLGSWVIAELTLDGSLRLEAMLSYELAATLKRSINDRIHVAIDRRGLIYLSDVP